MTVKPPSDRTLMPRAVSLAGYRLLVSWPCVGSGEAFAHLVRERLAGVAHLRTTVERVDPAIATRASYLVDVQWHNGPGVLCEVADTIETIRVMDPHGEDVSVEVALRYVEARAAGASSTHAWRFATSQPR